MSDLSETDTAFYVRDRDSFSSTGTGIEEPADTEGLLPFMFEPEYERDEVELFSSNYTAVTSNRPIQRMENTNWWVSQE